MKKEFAEILKNIENECVSYDEIVYLQQHQKEVKETGDIVLMQWACIEEE